LAKRKKIRTLGVSMGQGQETIARNYLATATKEGLWLLLQNTHLGLAYLSEVSQLHSPAVTGLACLSEMNRAFIGSAPLWQLLPVS
jgi:dynein heavy chain